MRTLTVMAFAAFAALQSAAFHVQIGCSYRSHLVDVFLKNTNNVVRYNSKPLRHPYFWKNVELGATPEYLLRTEGLSGPRARISFSDYVLVKFKNENYYTQCFIGPQMQWRDVDDTMSVLLASDGISGGEYTEEQGFYKVALAETVKVGDLPSYDGVSNLTSVVLTMRGDPYSFVMNDTAEDRTVNGVSIPAGRTASLKLPIYLKTPEIDGVKFYDLDSGVELETPDYWNGAYAPGYTGNIRISTATLTPTSAPDEKLVYGDMAAENADRLLYATNDAPIYSSVVAISTNITVNTWWDFAATDWGSRPVAKINDSDVCVSHTTGHIISHTVNTKDLRTNVLGYGVVYFTMSMTPQTGFGGGACVMRCWDSSMPNTADGYADTPVGHKAEVSAGTDVAKFKMTIWPATGKWSVEPAK